MKVLQVNCVYKKGSTGKIVCAIHTALQELNIESIVCYGRGEKIPEKNVYKTCPEWYAKIQNLFSRLTGLMYGGCFFSTNKLISIIKREKPDIVHLHCINGYFVNIYRLVSWLKKSGIKTILTLHAEFMYTANCGYAVDCEKWKAGCGKCPRYKQETKSWLFDGTHRSWKKMQKAFDGFSNLTVVSVSEWLMERAQQSPFLADKKHCVVYNGVDTDVFQICETDDLRANYGLKGEKVILHVTPSFSDNPNSLKGGYYVLKLAERMQNENVKLIVAGQYPAGLKVPSNVILLGRVSNQKDLAQLYSMADLTLLTCKRETFSMVCAESFCCGTPVVGFQAGAPEQISLPEYSKFVAYGDEQALYATVKDFLSKDFSKQEIQKKAEKKYAKSAMTNGYIAVYKEQ